VTNDKLKPYLLFYLREKASDKNSFPPRVQKIAAAATYSSCVCSVLVQCASVFRVRMTYLWLMVNRWQNYQGFLLSLDLKFPKCWRIFQKWWRAPHGPITVADPHRQLRVKSKFTNGVIPSRPPSWHDPLSGFHWWCLVQLLPLHWAHSGLEIQFVCGEASLLLQVFSEAILIPQSTLSRYKSNCGRLLQHHQFDKPPTWRGFQKVYVILTSGFLLV